MLNGPTTGVDLGFQIGGVHEICAKIFCSVPYSLSSPRPGLAPWNCDTIITIGINKHEVVENYNFEALFV